YFLIHQTDGPTLPGIPTQIVATSALPNRVHVTWKYDWGATRYFVYRATIPGPRGPRIGIATKLSYDDTTASPGRVYYYSVAAQNKAGLASPSNPVTGAAR